MMENARIFKTVAVLGVRKEEDSEMGLKRIDDQRHQATIHRDHRHTQ